MPVQVIPVKSSEKRQKRPDSMIAVMGPTGTGKSSLIQLLTKDRSIEIGHGVQSQTSDIKRANYFAPDGHCVTFVDTPGFDDSREGVSDTDILKKIAAFLESEYTGGRKLNGILYLHRITDNRMGGISVRNLRMFRKLCGSDSLKNVVIVTTRWDEVIDMPKAEERERELLDSKDFFGPLIQAEARFHRHYNSMETGKEILDMILPNDEIELDIQKEMAAGKKLEETSAGSELHAELKKLMEKHADEMKELRNEMDAAIAEKDEKLRKELEEEREKLTRQMSKWEADKKRLEEGIDEMRAEAQEQRKNTMHEQETQRQEYLAQMEKGKQALEKLTKQVEDNDSRLREANSSLLEEKRKREESEAERNTREGEWMRWKQEAAEKSEEMNLKHAALLERLQEALAAKEDASRQLILQQEPTKDEGDGRKKTIDAEQVRAEEARTNAESEIRDVAEAVESGSWLYGLVSNLLHLF